MQRENVAWLRHILHLELFFFTCAKRSTIFGCHQLKKKGHIEQGHNDRSLLFYVSHHHLKPKTSNQRYTNIHTNSSYSHHYHHQDYGILFESYISIYGIKCCPKQNMLPKAHKIAITCMSVCLKHSN